MCELGVFHIFLENDLLKVDKILGLTFFKASTVLEGFNTRYYTAFFNLLELSFFFSRWIVYNSRVFAYKKPFRELSVF